MKNISKDFSIIDRELTIDGTVSTSGRLIVKGVVKGKIIGENVVIAEEGSVFADTKVSSMTIGGTFEGEITANDELIILSTGSCSGTVLCRNLTVEMGGMLNATVTYINQTNSMNNKTGKSAKPAKPVKQDPAGTASITV